MSTHSIDDAGVAAQLRSSEQGRDVWRGILTGLIPLGLLIVVVAATLLLTTLARLSFASSAFFAQQQAAVIVLIAGVILAIAVFGLACPPANSGLAARRDESEGERGVVGTWRYRPGARAPGGARTPAAPAPLPMNDDHLSISA